VRRPWRTLAGLAAPIAALATAVDRQVRAERLGGPEKGRTRSRVTPIDAPLSVRKRKGYVASVWDHRYLTPQFAFKILVF
jgi:hypothetical protein